MHKPTIIFILILLVSFIIRLNNFDYPLLNGEAHRDYLVGRHIIKYQEFPLTGPCCLWNSTFGLVRNSPTYYYLIAAILSIKDDILFLGAVNITLQLLTITIVYLLAKSLFGPDVALISAILFSTSYEIMRQSLFFWQPHAMHPFILTSFLFLLLAWVKSNYRLLLTSIFFFFFAASLHNSVYAALPTFALLIFYILKRQKKSIIYYLSVLGVSLTTFLLLYFPWFIHATGGKETEAILRFSYGPLFVLSPAEFLNGFITTTGVFFKSFLFSPYIIFLMLIGLLLYFVLQKDRLKRYYFSILLIATIQFLLVASIFKSTFWSFYLTPVFGLFIILVAETINTVLSRNTLLKVAKVALIILLVKVFSFDFAYFYSGPPLKNERGINAGVQAIKSEVQNISLDSFRFKVYAGGIESLPTADLPFWSLLEKDLNRKFIRVVDSANSYELINRDDYIFVVCQSYPSRIRVDRDCLGPFFKEKNNYRLVKAVFNQEPFLIYLTSSYSY